MPYQYPEIKTWKGLHMQANSLGVPDGALEKARNILIASDDTITKIRGSYLYWTPGVGVIPNSLMVYNGALFCVCEDRLYRFADDATPHPNEKGAATLMAGETVAASLFRSRSAFANKNIYFTSDNGVLKLESTASRIWSAGTPPALDCRAYFLADNGGIGDDITDLACQAAYRVVFGRRDSNGNLYLGAPSDSVTLTNAAVASTWERGGAGPYTVTVTTPAAHNLSSGMEIKLTATPPTGASTTPVITVVSPTTFTWSQVGDPGISGSVTWATTRAARLEASIPSEINSTTLGYFAQIYRSTNSVNATTEPSQNYKLVDEYLLSASDIARGFFLFDDILATMFLGAELYTNPNSREGEDQANWRPPLCKDMASFRSVMLYAGAKQRHLINVNLISDAAIGTNGATAATWARVTNVTTITKVNHGLAAGQLIYAANSTGTTPIPAGIKVVATTPTADTFTIADTAADDTGAVDYAATGASDFVEVKLLTTTRRYVPRLGLGNDTAAATGSGTGTITIAYPNHGFVAGDVVYFSEITGTLPEGEYTVASPTAAGFAISAATRTCTACLITGRKDVSGYFMFQWSITAVTLSVAAAVRETAVGFVRAINRDSASLIYANYVSFVTDVPGLMRFQAKGFGSAFSFRAGTAPGGACFSPVLPTSFSTGTQITSQADENESYVYASKEGMPEAVPLPNYFMVGTRNNRIKRIIALQDTTLVLSTEGVFRIDGYYVRDFRVTPIDTTVICIAENSVDKINNQAAFLSNQGLCLATSNSVKIVSRIIERPISAVLGNANLETETCGFAYESARLYFLTTIAPRGTAAGETYVFNNLSGGWSTWEKLATCGIVGPQDTMYYLATDGTLMRERKNATKIDYCGQNYTVSIVSVSSDKLSAVITSSGTNPAKGDIIVKADVISRIGSVVAQGTDWLVTFRWETNLVNSDTSILYKGYPASFRLSPFHGGKIGLMKQFAQMQIHQRNPSISSLDISFSGQVLGLTEVVEWRVEDISSSGGWGAEYWGFFPWGMANVTDEVYETMPAPVIRTFLPITQQRNNYIQPQIDHYEAGEPLEIQAMTFAVKPYRERVTR